MSATDSASTVLAPGTQVSDFKIATESGEDHTRGDFTVDGADTYGVSCDSSWSQKAFRGKLGVSIPQLSDFEPKGAACAAFGVLHSGGFPQRALVIVGPEGIVRWSYQAPSPADLPPVHMILGGLKNV